MNSMPEELDTLERDKIRQLEVEREAIKRENDDEAKLKRTGIQRLPRNLRTTDRDTYKDKMGKKEKNWWRRFDAKPRLECLKQQT